MPQNKSNREEESWEESWMTEEVEALFVTEDFKAMSSVLTPKGINWAKSAIAHLAHNFADKVASSEFYCKHFAEKKEIIKSYGGCKECYGKGYSTQIYGEGGEGYEIAPTVHMNFCTCERGRQLKSLLLKKDN